jgi:uncharacterized repeat protein (TIGR03806 family)
VRFLVATALAALAGCSNPPATEDPLNKLSEYNLFVGPLAQQNPGPNLVPYDVVSPLYADGAGKFRFLSLPTGTKIHFDPTGRWTFPDGAMIVKTFYFDNDARNPAAGRKLLETRLLIFKGGTWETHTYVWNDAQDDATVFSAGEALHVDFVDGNGMPGSVDYQVPSTSQCKNCHGQNKVLTSLGPRTRQLNRDHDYGAGAENQIAHLQKLGLFDVDPGPPAMLDALVDPRGTDTVEKRARSYLDANCAHCHNSGGYASSTNLQLNIETTNPIDLGICRHPVAAGPASGGFLFDVFPGQPNNSIMTYRMKSNDPQIKMPQLPLTTVDTFGADLITQWIAGRTDPACQ